MADKMGSAIAVCLLLLGAAPSPSSAQVTIYNRDGVTAGAPGEISSFDIFGNARDYSLSSIIQVGSTFYSYGLGVGCGWRYGIPSTPFCGFNAYSSTDLVNWTKVGAIFDPNSDSWQANCDSSAGGIGGCYVPRVIYNMANNNYVLWDNDSQQPQYYDVLTSSSPAGPFVKQTAPSHLAINTGGDEALFVDTGGTGYLVYETTGAGQIHIDQLNSSYTDSVGVSIAPSGIAGDSPFLFGPVSGVYHLLWSAPCAICSGAAVHHATASSVFGTWTIQSDISSNACGGQFIGAYPLTIASTPVWLYQTGLRGNTVTTSSDTLGMENIYEQLLTFTGSTLNPVTCQNSVTISGLTPNPPPPLQPTPNQTDETATPGFAFNCDITSSLYRLQEFIPSTTIAAPGVTLPIGQSTAACGSGCTGANGNLTVSLVNTSSDVPSGVISSVTLTGGGLAGGMTFAPLRQAITFPSPSQVLNAGTKYGIELSGSNSQGCFAEAYSDSFPYASGLERYSTDSGSTWTTEANVSLKFSVFNSLQVSGGRVRHWWH
jgi:Glycosyl hydrolases family 43